MAVWKAVMSGVPLGPYYLTSSYCHGNIDSGIECTLSKGGDDKFSGLTLEGKNSIQRDLDRLESWAWAVLKYFNKAKC